MWLPLDILQTDNAVKCEFWAEELTEDVCREQAQKNTFVNEKKFKNFIYEYDNQRNQLENKSIFMNVALNID